MESRKRFLIMATYMLTLIIIGFLWPSETDFLEGYYNVLTTPGILLSDFFAIGSISVGLVNAGIVGLVGLFLIYGTKTVMSGPTIAAVFTMAGFGLFGKTPINILPVILGVAFSAWLRKEKFRNIIVVGLFGTALGPVVSQIAFGLELGYWAGAIIGIIVGMLLPALASHVLHNHQGFNLYNVGFTCGIVGMYVAAHLKMRGFALDMPLIWYEDSQLALGIVFTLYFVSLIIIGWNGQSESGELRKSPGTLVTDFVTNHGFSAALYNMGLVGLMGMAYIVLVQGAFNGPTLGGVMTIVGFGAFGKHVRNIWPVMLGVWLATQLSAWQTNMPGPILAALFGTTLAPIAGGLGPVFGILAGMVHLAVVMHVAVFHAGMNLYNNGFAGGLVGTLFIGVTRWFNFGRNDE